MTIYINKLNKGLLILYLIIMVVHCISCSRPQNQDNKNFLLLREIEPINKDYIETKKFFKTKYVKHFPAKLDSSYITFTESLSPELGEISLDLTCKLFDKKKSKNFSQKSIATYYPYDTCLLIVNRFATKDNFYNIKLSDKDKNLINNSCFNKLYPIPNFWDSKFATVETKCKLPQDFIISVIEAEPGKFIDEKYLTDGSLMPNKWKNGFSRGVAISEKRKIIIYWLVIW